MPPGTESLTIQQRSAATTAETLTSSVAIEDGEQPPAHDGIRPHRLSSIINIDVHCHRQQMNPELEAWLETVARNHPVRKVVSRYDICTARRQSLANFIRNDVQAGYTHLIQLDDDLVPVPKTKHILVEPGDLVYCGIAGRAGKWGHYGDGDFGAACCRISAKLAGELDTASSFDYGFNEDRTEMTRCECQVFYDQARHLGYESRMVGIVGHCVNIVIVPTHKGVIQRWPAGG